MERTKVSVLMGVQNLEKYISQSIESVLTQTFTDFEFIILDDGSTDRTLEIIKEYAAKDDRIRYFSFPQRWGLPMAAILQIEKSVGKYLARMDGGRFIEARKTDAAGKYLDSTQNVAFAFPGEKLLMKQGKRTL